MTAPVKIRCLSAHGDAPRTGPAFTFDGPGLLPDPGAVCGVLLPSEGERRAAELLAAGVPCVLLGEAALRDSSAIERLAGGFGEGRVGVYVPAKRMRVSWSLDPRSNADFKVMTPSVCEPCWEVLTHEGERTGTIASWWIGEMFARGASVALVRADIRDDADLDICARLVEQCGERLWIGPLEDEAPGIADWVAYGKATQLVLSRSMIEENEQLAALPGAGEDRAAA